MAAPTLAPTTGWRSDEVARSADRIRGWALGLSLAVLAVFVVGGAIATLGERADAIERWTVVRGIVVDGRSSGGGDFEVLVQYPANGGWDERWMDVESFHPYERGSVVDVAFPDGAPEQAQIEAECDCVPARVALPPIVPSVFVLFAVFATVRVWYDARRPVSDGWSQPQPVRAWWAGPRSCVLRLHHPDAAPGTGHTAGPVLAVAVLPASYRGEIADGDLVAVGGSSGERVGPKQRVRLGTAQGWSSRTVLLLPPTKAKRVLNSTNATRVAWLASIGRRQAPLGIEEARRCDLGAALTAGTSVLIFALWALAHPWPWSAAAAFAVAPFVLALAVAVWVRVGIEDDLDARLLWGETAPPPVEPPPFVAAPSTASSHGLDGDRTPSESIRWLGGGLSVGLVGIYLVLMCFVVPPIAVVALVGGVVAWRRRPRPVVARYRRPGLPLWLATVPVMGAAFAWQYVIGAEDAQAAMPLRVLALPVTLALAVLAFRVAHVGLTVGGDAWVVRNLLHTVRIPADEVVGESLRPNRGIVPSAGLLVHRRNGEDVVVSRYALSRRVAKVVRREQEVARALAMAPSGASSVPMGGPIAAPAPGAVPMAVPASPYLAEPARRGPF